LPDTLFYTNQYATSKGANEQHAANGKWEWKPDTLTTVKFTTAFTRKTTGYLANTRTESLSEERKFVNNGDRENEGTNTRLQNDNSLQYKRLFKKTGRQLIASVRLNVVDDEGDGTLAYTNRFFKNGVLDSTETADQAKTTDGHATTIGGKLTYSEPLSAKVSLIMDYSYNGSNSSSNRNTLEKSISGKYDKLIPLFSNKFDLSALSHTGILSARYLTKKVVIGVGSGLSTVQLDLLNKDNGVKRNYNFLNFTPQSSMSYTFKQNSSVRLNYRGNTVQPNLEQLQPLRNNNDPLNIVIGNPNLEVGFRHRINLSYNYYKVLSQTGMWTSLSYNVTQRAITNITTIDAFGRKTTMPVNVNGNRSWNFWGEWNKGEGEKKLNHTAELSAGGNVYNNFINGNANRTNSFNYEIGYGLRYEVEEKWSLHIEPKIGHNTSVSSLNKAAKTSFFTYGGESEGYLKLPGAFEIRSDVEFDWRQRISAFDANPNLTIWNAELSKKVLKDKSGTISILARDILNSNRGFSRLINSNFITEDRSRFPFTILTRGHFQKRVLARAQRPL
jgi:hypothetical protein